MPKRSFLILIVSLAACGFVCGESFAQKPSGAAADFDEAPFAGNSVQLDLTGSILQLGPRGVYPTGRQRAKWQEFQLGVAGPTSVPLSLDPIPWSACSMYKLSLPVDYLTPAPLEAWTAGR